MCYTFGGTYLDKYSFVKFKEAHRYEFSSKGPKGIIRKIVEYDSMKFQPFLIFNLSFGDWDAHTGESNDTVVSNNKDRKKILSTVAATVLEFIRDRPKAVVHAKGSTPSRTRLYQMGLCLILSEIKYELDVFGRKNGVWYKFKKGINYDAFMVAHKSVKFNPNYIDQ